MELSAYVSVSLCFVGLESDQLMYLLILLLVVLYDCQSLLASLLCRGKRDLCSLFSRKALAGPCPCEELAGDCLRQCARYAAWFSFSRPTIIISVCDGRLCPWASTTPLHPNVHSAWGCPHESSVSSLIGGSGVLPALQTVPSLSDTMSVLCSRWQTTADTQAFLSESVTVLVPCCP